MTLPEFPEFKEIELSDKHDVEAYFSLAVRGGCEYSFPNLYMWRDFDRPRLTTVNGNLCVLINPLDESPFFLEPVGNGNVLKTLNFIMEHTGKISRASKSFVEKLSENKFRAPLKTSDKHHLSFLRKQESHGNMGSPITPFGDDNMKNRFLEVPFKISHIRDQDDYVYRVRDLANLKGGPYDGKRNHIKVFERKQPQYKFAQLNSSHRDEALHVFDVWRDSKKSDSNAHLLNLAFDCQRWALERAFEDFDALKLIGCGIWASGKLLGFLIASSLSSDTACVHFEYHLPDVQGVAQTIFWQACQDTLSGFEFVNLEQDLGIAGLRRHKESYHPLKMEEKFEITI